MQPGYELDRLVADAMGLSVIRPFSTGWAEAGLVWEWLQANYPSRLCLGPNISGKPAVFVVDMLHTVLEFISEGETWPHAIALAVVEISRRKR